MMDDKELLTLAARAAGIVVVRSRLTDPLNFDMLVENSARNVGQLTGAWNPLTDDGDALRLAVKLHLTLRMWSGNTCAQSGAPGTPVAYVNESTHDDPCAATRRAIVRAAAEIGRGM